MDEERGSDSVREQLIIAGIAELENHGIADFSLRRVASVCNISCAAPYKHFKNKEMLIEANGNLLLKVPQAKEEDSFFDGGSKKEENKPFDFRSVFDEKGKFKR